MSEWRYELDDGSHGTVVVTDQDAAWDEACRLAGPRSVILIENLPPLTPTVVRQRSPDGKWWEQTINNAGHAIWVPVNLADIVTRIEPPGGA